MTPGVFIFSFFLYGIIAYTAKRMLYPFDKEQLPCPIVDWQCGHEHTLIVSPDYWWAFRFKSGIKGRIPNDNIKEALKSYVEKNNKFNLFSSIVLAVFCLALYSYTTSSLLSQTLSAIAIIRLFSRSYEIAYAFGCDVFQKHESATGLKKHERIRLALFSYFEIFFYSAAAYTALPTIASASEAVTLALNVGTLTNVGYAFGACGSSFVTNIVFIQVFATLSLVVLSLAAYLSRNENA